MKFEEGVSYDRQLSGGTWETLGKFDGTSPKGCPLFGGNPDELRDLDREMRETPGQLVVGRYYDVSYFDKHETWRNVAWLYTGLSTTGRCATFKGQAPDFNLGNCSFREVCEHGSIVTRINGDVTCDCDKCWPAKPPEEQLINYDDMVDGRWYQGRLGDAGWRPKIGKRFASPSFGGVWRECCEHSKPVTRDGEHVHHDCDKCLPPGATATKSPTLKPQATRNICAPMSELCESSVAKLPPYQRGPVISYDHGYEWDET